MTLTLTAGVYRLGSVVVSEEQVEQFLRAGVVVTFVGES